MPTDELKTVQDPQSPADLNALLPSPGEDGYIFFQNANQHPYEKTLDFSLVNAHWMLDTSYLAYGVNGEYVSKQLEGVGLNAALFGWDSDVPPHILVAHDARVIVVAFRGTRIQDLADVLADAAFLPSLTAHGSVHQGFQHTLLYGGRWDEVKRHL